MEAKFSLINKTRMQVPHLPLKQIKNDILGRTYFLSIAYVGETKSKEINKTYRDKDKPTNVLSFPLHASAGELVLCPSQIKKNMREKLYGDLTFEELLGFLVIHGILHLKGMAHSSTMERAEKKYVKKYFHRYRRGHAYSQGRGRRVPKRKQQS
jgi:rRNA maturation RNase YbeY